MISEGLRKQAFWLYGVIIGLAIKDALEIAIGHLMVPPDGSFRDFLPESTRFWVFLLTAIQFYLGSAWFFDKFHEQLPEETTTNPTRTRTRGRYAVDFLFGLSHFLLFFAWAISLDTHKGHLHLFSILLVVMLLYDWIWCWISRGLDTYSEIRKWSLTNAAVITAAVAFYGVAYFILIVVDTLQEPAMLDFWAGDPYRHRIAEPIAMIPVLVIACVDIVGTITDKRLVADWVVRRFK